MSVWYSDEIEDELGRLSGVVRLTVCDRIMLVVVSSCRVPLSLQEKVKLNLCEVEEQGIFAKVDKPTDYVSRLALSLKKSGYIRICIDPHGLNRALKMEKSSYLCFFQTPCGRYRWQRLPFRLAVSSDIFQKRLDTRCLTI